VVTLDAKHEAIALLEREGLADSARHRDLTLRAEASRDFHDSFLTYGLM
jgi:hypothetical protein